MRIAAALLLLSLNAVVDTTTAPVAPERVPIRISSLETGFTTKGAFIGTADVYPESVVVAFDSTYITQFEYQGRSSYHLDSMTVGLAIGSGDRWHKSGESAALTIADSLAERVTFSLGKVRFTIPRPPAQPIKGSWLLVTFYAIVSPSLVPREQQSTGATYAHSARGIFSDVTVPSYTTPVPLPPAQVPVRISSLHTSFVTKGLLIGNAAVYPESVVVTFDSTEIRQSEYEAGRASEHLDSITVGLAAGPREKWRIASNSAALTIADSLAERVAFSPGKLRFRIPRPPGESLLNSWLVVTFHQILIPSIMPHIKHAGSTTHAHSAAIFSRLHGR